MPSSPHVSESRPRRRTPGWRALVDRGVITGFHASVDERMLGAGLQAIIGVTLRPSGRRESIVEFADRVRVLPPVIQLFFLGGDDDFLLHIAVADSSEMREFVLEHPLGAEQRRLHPHEHRVRLPPQLGGRFVPLKRGAAAGQAP